MGCLCVNVFTARVCVFVWVCFCVRIKRSQWWWCEASYGADRRRRHRLLKVISQGSSDPPSQAQQHRDIWIFFLLLCLLRLRDPSGAAPPVRYRWSVSLCCQRKKKTLLFGMNFSSAFVHTFSILVFFLFSWSFIVFWIYIRFSCRIMTLSPSTWVYSLGTSTIYIYTVYVYICMYIYYINIYVYECVVLWKNLWPVHNWRD